jgi:hypothetical protein
MTKGLLAEKPLFDLGTNPGTGLSTASSPEGDERKDTCLDSARTSERRAPAARKTKKRVFLVSKAKSMADHGEKG